MANDPMTFTDKLMMAVSILLGGPKGPDTSKLIPDAATFPVRKDPMTVSEVVTKMNESKFVFYISDYLPAQLKDYYRHLISNAPDAPMPHILVNTEDKGAPTISIITMLGPDKKPHEQFILLNKQALFHSPEMIALSKLLLTNDKIEQQIKDGTLQDENGTYAKTGAGQHVYKIFKEAAAETLGYIPPLYYSPSLVGVTSSRTEEGREFVMFGSALPKLFNDKELKATFEHELGHLAHGDLTAEHTADARNYKAVRYFFEFNADSTPKDPAAMKSVLTKVRNADLAQYKLTHPNASPADFEAFEQTAPSHPSNTKRIEKLDAYILAKEIREAVIPHILEGPIEAAHQKALEGEREQRQEMYRAGAKTNTPAQTVPTRK